MHSHKAFPRLSVELFAHNINDFLLCAGIGQKSPKEVPVDLQTTPQLVPCRRVKNLPDFVMRVIHHAVHLFNEGP